MDQGKLHLQIISPTAGYIFNDYCAMATIPAEAGVMGVMPGHESVVTILQEGVVGIYNAKEELIGEITIKSGFAEILDNKLLILVNG